MTKRWLVAACVALGACDGGTVLTGDGGGDRADAVDADAAGEDAAPSDGVDGVVDDGGASDAANEDAGVEASCTTEAHWELELRTIEEVDLVDVEPARYGATDRLRIQVRLRSACERLGRVDVELTAGGATDFASLRAWAWVPRGLDCPPSAPLVPWIVLFPGREQGNFRVLVEDGGSPGGGLRLEYGREIGCSGIPECECHAGTPAGTATEGSPCVTDCSCAEGLSCIGSYGVGGPYWACARPCNDLLDCGPYEICEEPVPDGMPWVCSGPTDQCSTDRPCPDGFDCVTDTGDAPNACVDRRAWEPLGTPCGCDETCGGAGNCVGSTDPPVAPRCVIPCLRDVDCDPDGSWFCSWDNTCQFSDGYT
ncbi:MAG: hypothetical protein HY907_19840 [Deltaproteobacteria bacterium]|nr:hypothetical protein [Deltaproteobacteria bacterium]